MSKRKLNRARREELEKTLAELEETRSALFIIRRRFDAVTDEAVLDACIYEMSALQSRYNCAIRQIKSLYQ